MLVVKMDNALPSTSNVAVKLQLLASSRVPGAVLHNLPRVPIQPNRR